MFHRMVEGDKDPWVRLHLFESKNKLSEKNRSYEPTWKVGHKDVLSPQQKKGYSPFWIDVYLKGVAG